MGDFPISDEFESDEDLIRFFSERVDDVDSLRIMVVKDILMSGPNGEKKLVKNCCSQIVFCDGTSRFMHTEDLQKIIDSGSFQRNGIKIELIPQIKLD